MSLVQSANSGFIKTICFLGAGYVGGPTSAVIAAQCPDIHVNVVDLSAERVEAWNSGDFPVKEPFLEEFICKSLGVNLFFTTDARKSIEEAQVIFISVNTPTKSYGMGAGTASDLSSVYGAANLIAKFSQNDKIIVMKSTVPVGTCAAISKYLNEQGIVKFTLLSNPEFLAEGTAIRNLLSPDRVLIGALPGEDGSEAQRAIASVYEHWVPSKSIVLLSAWSSELAKLASNSFLAQRISSINSLSAVCEATGADIKEVAKAVGLDPRIGSQFLMAGVGFGGSCFQKDVLNLVSTCKEHFLSEAVEYWEGVVKINDWQKRRAVKRIVDEMFSTIRGKKIAVLGFAFKKDTGDTRETPAKDIVDGLIEEGAVIHIFDPLVEASQIYQDVKLADPKYLKIENSVKSACSGAEAVVVCTDWSHFLHVDWRAVYEEMKKPALFFDGRLVLDASMMSSIGFKYLSIGLKPDI